MCLAGCQLIAQTQGYQLVCIWGSLVKFQGGGVVLNFDALPHLDAVCMQAMLSLIFQVNKQLTWRLEDLVSLRNFVLDGIFETNDNTKKWGELGKWFCNR